MEKWFESQNRLVQLIILLIPGINWIVEIGVRWSHALRKDSLFKYLIAILVTFFGLVFGWIDLVWCLLFKHLIFCD